MINLTWLSWLPYLSSLNNNDTISVGVVEGSVLTRYAEYGCDYMSKWAGEIFTLLLHLIFFATKNIAQVCLLLVHLSLMLIVIAFTKSIRPRFRLISPDTREKQLALPLTAKKDPPADQTRVGQSKNRYDGITIIDEARKFRETCLFSISNLDIKTIHRRLSWTETQLELESVNWINQTFLTFWPSIKTLLHKFLIEYDSSKQKPSEKSKSISSGRPKLSIYLSCRRKLILLLRARTMQMKSESPINNLIKFLFFSVRIFVLYAKQFIIDQVANFVASFSKVCSSSAGGSEPKPDQKDGRKIDLDELLKANKTTWTLGKEFQSKSIEPDNVKQTVEIKQASKKANSIKANSTPATRMLGSARGLVSPHTKAKLRDRRLRLLHNIDRARDTINRPKATIIESLKLGNTLPAIAGIKYIEADNNILLAEAHHNNRYITPSDDSNMRLLVEMSYESDKYFNIEFSSLPVLNRLRLTKLSFQLRFMLTINHSSLGQDKNLEIFDKPDNVLFPFINQAKFALVDAFHIDWHVKRATETNLIKMNRLEAINHKDSKMRQTKLKLIQLALRYLDPIKLINHNYFKYLVHMVIYLSQRWMKPFDISLGDRLIIRTLY